jgi:hypothetical protein
MKRIIIILFVLICLACTKTLQPCEPKGSWWDHTGAFDKGCYWPEFTKDEQTIYNKCIRSHNYPEDLKTNKWDPDKRPKLHEACDCTARFFIRKANTKELKTALNENICGLGQSWAPNNKCKSRYNAQWEHALNKCFPAGPSNPAVDVWIMN